ncbi:MAG: hypothetical protein K0S08_2165 [Gammaproteobacteria bacterium]|jgi:uncharacterized protein YndB with AHSA1/START domain|nr:hypothetical protein [Gammaproteobacteria bacterium]
MTDYPLESPAAKTGMLIRKPVAEVFEAFINPEITCKFWFSKGSAKLEAGKQVEWTWEMYNLIIPVNVKKIEPNKTIIVEWGDHPYMSTVEWSFTSLGEKGTYVSITNSGFHGSQAELIAQVSDSTKGFTFLLAGLKAWLEHGIQLNLVVDAFPKELHLKA